MRNALFITAGAVFCLFCGSCGDEPLNAECDIEQVSLHLDSPIDVFYHDYDTLQTVSSASDSIGFMIRSYASVGFVPVTLKVTDGASVYIIEEKSEKSFVNGQELDFSDEKVQLLRVVSEDRNWHRDYKLAIIHDVPSDGDMTFDFNLSELEEKGKYYVWPITDTNASNGLFGGKTDATWKNGNPGFRLAVQDAAPDAYPSSPVRAGSYDGTDCVKLETKSTGVFGKWLPEPMPIAPGSMFLGEFDVENALKNALKATQFGLPFGHKPVKISAWLRYETIEGQYKDRKGKLVEGIIDEPDMYIVFYRNQDEEGNRIVLDGNNMLTSPFIVGLARLEHRTQTDEDGVVTDLECGNPIHGITDQWQKIEMDVEYSRPVDEEILANKGYSLTIGFASSWQGAVFRGTEGSKLYIDNVTVICEK